MRIGYGYDVHKLVENRKLILGGVDIPYEKGLLGHSDADVLIHAVIDSLLGAAALRDIGYHFPDSDEKYRGVSSIFLMKETAKLLKNAGFEISNIDSTIIAQQPKLAPYIPQMIKNISEALGIREDQINIKGKTEEKLGFTGNGEGMKAEAVCLINEIND
ncbi:MAG: 2-C-methyl-D-erythritol 2,4-cyclodiphosphate synthase [Clostridia bacterium]|nr:2-C-methyl-D-erythritol 2,4-cyclodiphosphate synthase [Clostridia bacterium]